MRRMVLVGLVLCFFLPPQAARGEWALTLCVQLSHAGEVFYVQSYDGTQIGTFFADANGQRVLSLPAGVYVAQTQTGRAVFELTQTRLRVCSGVARSARGRLMFDEIPCGTVRVRAQGGGTLCLVLRGAEYEAQTEGTGGCCFDAVPYGSYVLYESGVPRANVIVCAGSPEVELVLKE